MDAMASGNPYLTQTGAERRAALRVVGLQGLISLGSAGIAGLIGGVRAGGSALLGGVMAMAPLGVAPAQAFAPLPRIAAAVRANHPEAVIVSAGMSGDLEEAIAAGATHVRVGTALLGGRQRFVR